MAEYTKTDVSQMGCFFMQNKIRFVLAIEDFEEAESIKSAGGASGKACAAAQGFCVSEAKILRKFLRQFAARFSDTKIRRNIEKTIEKRQSV